MFALCIRICFVIRFFISRLRDYFVVKDKMIRKEKTHSAQIVMALLVPFFCVRIFFGLIEIRYGSDVIERSIFFFCFGNGNYML